MADDQTTRADDRRFHPVSDRPATLNVRGLSALRDHRRVLDGIDFTVAPGEVFGIIGPSGAGKTTLLSCLTGTLSCDGRVGYGTDDYTSRPPRRRRFGNVYQEFRLFEWATVWANVAFPGQALGRTRDEIATGVRWALDRVHLTGFAERSVRTLSGGEMQRVALARAIAYAPRALFLDEPFSDLDWPLRADLRRDLADIVAETRVPTILVTHDRSEAFALCDRIGVLIDGRLHQVATPHDLLRAPVDHATAEFIGFTNGFTGCLTGRDGNLGRFAALGTTWTGTVSGPLSTGDALTARFRPGALQPATGANGAENACMLTLLGLHETEDYLLANLEHPGGGPWTAHWPLTFNRPAIGSRVLSAIATDDLRLFPISQ